MKRILNSLVFVLLVMVAGAQNYHVMEQLKADPRRAYGNDYPYNHETRSLTKAPRGYKPFYISHYGRHGSRYYWNDRLYKDLDTLLTTAHERHQLTPEGEAFHDRFMAVKSELMAGWSELTQLGWEQHQTIARDMYSHFQDVFRHGGKVMAISSLVGRCVISMSAFCQELVQCNPKIEIREQSSRMTLHGVAPDNLQNPLRREFPKCTPRYEQRKDEIPLDTIFTQALLSRVFTSTDGLPGNHKKIRSLLTNLYTSLPSIAHEGMMGNILSDEELASQWESDNLGGYSWMFGTRYKAIPILEDIIRKADDILEGRSNRLADLRFGHDTYIGPLTVLLGINGADSDPEDPAKVKYCYQNWETCMASNIQLIFYHSKKSADEILIKCLLNGEEATLPVPTTQAPYYRWSDFKDYYQTQMMRVQ